MVWVCPMQAGNAIGEEKFGYAGWSTKGKRYAEEDWTEVVKIYLNQYNLSADLDQDRIHVASPNIVRTGLALMMMIDDIKITNLNNACSKIVHFFLNVTSYLVKIINGLT